MVTSRGRAICVIVTALVVGPSCVDHEAGIGVEVTVEHDGGGDAPRPGAPRAFVTDLGYQVAIERGYFTTVAVDLVRCETVAAAAASMPPLAHTVGSATHMGAPLVDSLLAPDAEPVVAGDIEPPAASYCAANVTLGPADADAGGPPADVSIMVGRTILLEGTWVGPDGGEATAFSVSTGGNRARHVPLDPPLAADADHLSSRLRLTSAYAGWLDGIDLAAATPEALAQSVLATAAQSWTATVEAAP